MGGSGAGAVRVQVPVVPADSALASGAAPLADSGRPDGGRVRSHADLVPCRRVGMAGTVSRSGAFAPDQSGRVDHAQPAWSMAGTRQPPDRRRSPGFGGGGGGLFSRGAAEPI